MAEARFLMITFNLRHNNGDVKQIINSRASDWLKFNSYTWIVRTDETPQQWYAWLKPSLTAKESVLVAEVNLRNRSGQAVPVVWEWMKKHGT